MHIAKFFVNAYSRAIFFLFISKLRENIIDDSGAQVKKKNFEV